MLDVLLADERVAFDGVSGTSAGAMNAAVMAYGWAQGGRAGARAALETFWRRVADIGSFSPLKPSAIERWFGGWSYDRKRAFTGFDLLSRLFSPYQVNPFNYNPLRQVIEQTIDFKQLHKSEAMRLFVAATNVRSGKSRIFSGSDVTVDALLASACLPVLFQAVEIDGQSYWDGGFVGNPALYPLLYNCDSRDIVIVQINPLHIDETPKGTYEIFDRVNEISFNASLMAEVQAIEFVTRQLREQRLDEDRYRAIHLHMVDAEKEMRQFGYASKLTADWPLMVHLKEIGNQAACEWLKKHFGDLGERSSINFTRFLSGDQKYRERPQAKPR